MYRSIQVRLKTDLTKLMKGIVIKSEGCAIGRFDMWSRANDDFAAVNKEVK